MTAADLNEFPIGKRVAHVMYGEGTVTEHEPDKGVLRVKFDDDGRVVRLIARYAPLTLPNGQAMTTHTFDATLIEQEVREEVKKQTVRRMVAEALRAAEQGPQRAPDGGFLRELLARPDEPSWRVHGLIPADAGTLVVAARKTGKTTFNLNLARSLLTGEDFLGRFEVEPIEGIVAVLNFEVGGKTFARWANEHGIDPDRLYVENLRGRRNPFRHPEDRAVLAEKLRDHGTEALIVDPFGRAYTGKSQNDPGEVTAWLVALDEFARSEVGARDVILNAHAGWNGERTRGSSSLEDWADVFVTMTRDADDDAQRFIKAEGRDVLLDEDRLDFHAGTRTLSLAGVGSRRQVKDEKKVAELAVLVVRAAREHPGASLRTIESAVKGMDDAPSFRSGDVSKAARFAESKGFLTITRSTNGRSFALTATDPDRSPTDPREHPLTAPTAPYRGAVAVAVGAGADGVLDLGAVRAMKETAPC